MSTRRLRCCHNRRRLNGQPGRVNHEMELPTQKLVHTFGALADLGQEITDSNNVHDMVLTSLQLLTGALAIRRSAIFEYVPSLNSLCLVASRGIDPSFPQTFEIDQDIRAALLAVS